MSAVRALHGSRDGHVRLRVRCGESHRVATVYATDVGLVYVARSGPRAHGSKDFLDAAHHDAAHGTEVADLVELGPDDLGDDELPASCECGPRSVSRAQLLEALRSGQRRLLVN